MVIIIGLLIRKSFSYRIYPTPTQQRRLAQWEASLRFLWNLANEQRRLGFARPRGEKRFPTAADQQRELTELRSQLHWLADVPRNVSAQLLARLDVAWRRFFERTAGMPDWKRKDGSAIAMTETHADIWCMDDGAVHFPKLGRLKTVLHRPLLGKSKTCTVLRRGDQWFASIVCEIELADPAPRDIPVVAIDRGVINAVADSDGRIIPSPRFYERSMKCLARALRAMCRRKKGSKNREKAKLKVARLHRKIRRQREHFVHQLSHDYTKSHGTVVVEKLNVGGMVRANRGLARGILDAGWGKLVECLRYKLAWSGGTLVDVPAAYSSQTCSACGTVDAKARRRERFRCVGCGHTDHADINAAKVLKSRWNPSALPVEGSASKGPLRSRKSPARMRVTRKTLANASEWA